MHLPNISIVITTIEFKNTTEEKNALVFRYNEVVTESSYHILFSLILIGFYIRKLIQKKNDQFKYFQTFHVFMYLSLTATIAFVIGYFSPYFSSLLLSTIYVIISGIVQYEMIPIQSIILFQLYIEIKEFKSGNLKKVAVVYGLIITVFALASSLVRVMVEHDDLRIKFHTLEFILPFLTLILLAIQLIQWMCMNVKINEKSLCVFVNSLFCHHYLIGKMSVSLKIKKKSVKTETKAMIAVDACRSHSESDLH
uniref:Serpentine receptor class gamma n=1 Tax=Caenorhabditis tropicalis TaxID=1561998 RepID=A0A1I7UT95_9PELO